MKENPEKKVKNNAIRNLKYGTKNNRVTGRGQSLERGMCFYMCIYKGWH